MPAEFDRRDWIGDCNDGSIDDLSTTKSTQSMRCATWRETPCDGVLAGLQSNNGDALIEAAVAGFGLTYTPEFMAADALAAGHLRQTLAEFPIAELGISVVLPSNRHVPHRVRVLMDFLADRLGPEPPWKRTGKSS